MRPLLSRLPSDESILTKKDQEDLEGNLIAHPACTLQSPVELLKHTAARLDLTPDQSSQNLWGWGLSISIFLLKYSPDASHGIRGEKHWVKASVDSNGQR